VHRAARTYAEHHVPAQGLRPDASGQEGSGRSRASRIRRRPRRWATAWRCSTVIRRSSRSSRAIRSARLSLVVTGRLPWSLSSW